MRTRILLPLIAGSLSWVSIACGTDPAGNGDVLPDAGNAQPDAGQHPADAGDPDAGKAGLAPETWNWVDVPESACGNGAPTGIGVNPTERSTDLFLYLQGGGACWNAQTCFTLKTATYIETGYGEADFQKEPFTGIFAADREAPTNPLRDMSFAFVPYCTGDVHSGDAVTTYGTKQVHHKGAKNMEAFLDRLRDIFPNVTRVFLSGSSAGGFGAQINYERVVQAFPSAEVHLLADSAQMINPNGTLLDTWMTTWKSAPPASCLDCLTDFTKLPAFLADAYPERRFGLLAFDRDTTLTFFFGYNADPAVFKTETLSLLSSVYDGRSNAKYFLKEGTEHTMIGLLDTITSSTGVPLKNFVTAWVNGDATWESVSEVAP